MSESLLAREIDYKTVDLSHGTYIMNQLTPMTGGTTATITITGGNDVIFEINPKVINYSKSYIKYTQSCPALATNATTAYAEGCPAIRQIQFYTRGRCMPVDIADVNKYLAGIGRHVNKIDSVLGWDNPTVTAAYSSANGYNQTLYCSNNTAANVPRPFDSASAAVGTAKTSFLEPAYLMVGTAQNAINLTNWNIPLSCFYNTLLAMDKDILFNETCYLRIVWAPSTSIYYTHTATANVYTGSAPAVGDVSMTNIGLFLATEQNPLIEADLRKKVSEGFSIPIPFVYANKIALGTGSITCSTRYSRGHGKKLKALYWIPYNLTESGRSGYDHSNSINAGVGTKITDFFVTVNNNRMHQFNLSCANGDDYLIARDTLKGSCILSSNEFYYNYMNKINFCDNYSPIDKPQFSPSEQNWSDGLLLDTEQLIDIRATATIGLNHYIFAVVERALNISDAGATLM